jgi:TonB family protein
MFEFAISKNQKRRPSSRIIITGVASCLIHFLAIIVLINNPQLLQGTVIPHILQKSIFYRTPKKQEETPKKEDGRIIAMLDRMQAPPAALLKRYMDALRKRGDVVPTTVVPLKNLKGASAGAIPPAPKLPESKTKPEITFPPPNPEPAPPLPLSSNAANPSAEPKQPIAALNKGSIPLPAPVASAAKQEGTVIKPPEPPKPAVVETAAKIHDPASESFKSFPSQEAANRNPNTSGIFDAKGYPVEKLEKYVQLIIGHVTGKWNIPSNLKNSQGRITVNFLIDRNGGFYDIRIVGKGSGNKTLDLTALNAVIDSNPVDPLPRDFPGDHLGAQFVFSYNEP